MKNLFATTAVLEIGTGLMLVAFPTVLVTLLLGTPLETPAGLTVARVGGAALLALGAACWFVRNDAHHRVAQGLVFALVVYNIGAFAILTHAGLALRLSGIGLWPAVAVHAAMAGWCITSLLRGGTPNCPA